MTKRRVPNVVRGGVAIPLKGKTNYYYMTGRKHTDGGIDIGQNPKTGIEVEDGEVMHITNNGARVFSAVPFLNGESPAEKVMRGENANKVFNEQERFKKVNNIKDDGSSKKQMGGDDEYVPLVLRDAAKTQKSNNFVRKYDFSSDRYRNDFENTNRAVLGDISNENTKVYKNRDGKLATIYWGDMDDFYKQVYGYEQLSDKEKQDLIKSYRRQLDYVGGDTNQSRKNMWSRLPKTKEFVDSIAVKYGISPELLTNRLNHEGFIDEAQKNYNYLSSAKEQKEFDDNLLSKTNVYDGFHDFGLDNTGEYLNKGLLNLRDSVDYWTMDAENEHKVSVLAADGGDGRSNIILQAATLEYMKKLMEERGIPQHKLETWTNAAYNMGPYHEDLKDSTFIENKYNFKKKLMGGDEHEINPITGRKVKKIKPKTASISIAGDRFETNGNRLPTYNAKEYNDNIKYIDRYLRILPMSIGRKLATTNHYYEMPTKDEIKNNKYDWNVAQNTYLMSKEDQKQAFLNSGYIEGTPGDYGLVRSAVGNRIIPIYQKNKDSISRDSLIHLGNTMAAEDFLQFDNNDNLLTLDHAGDYPIAVYHDNHGKLYFKGWDLNDYGLDANGNKGATYEGIYNELSNFVDKIGNPTVLTTGYQPYVQNAWHINKVIESVYNSNPEAYNNFAKNVEFDENAIRKLYDTYTDGHWIRPKGFEKNNEYKKLLNVYNEDYNIPTEEVRKAIPYDDFKNNILQYMDISTLIHHGIYPLNTDTENNKKRMGGKHNINNKELGSGSRGFYSVTDRGKTKYYMIPSTGNSSARSAEVRTKKLLGGNDDEVVITAARKPIKLGIPKLNYTPTYDMVYEAKVNKLFNPNEVMTAPVRVAKPNHKDNLPKKIAPISVTSVVPQKSNAIKDWWTDNKSNIIGDGIGLVSNIASSLISHSMNKNMLNRLKPAPQPIARQVAKLKTQININPQLDKMRETVAAYERNIDNNTSSSNVALARKQNARLANILNTNEIYGDKENIETGLINKDRLNQQAVSEKNVTDYNKWSTDVANFRNVVLEQKAENDVSLMNNLNAGIQNMLTVNDKRNAEKQTIAAMALANPNLPVEMFFKQGLISRELYNAYRKAYPKKNV